MIFSAIRVTFASVFLAFFSVAVSAAVTPKSDEKATGKRLALVIGIGDYENVGTLTNAVNDATKISSVLSSVGFDVHRVIDVDLTTLKVRLKEFVASADGADSVVVYYAGHGFQLDGHNHVIAKDFVFPEGGAKKLLGTINLSNLLAKLEKVAKTRILFLDACRDDPRKASEESLASVARSFNSRSVASRSAGAQQSQIKFVRTGFSEMRASIGTYIAFATGVGDTALDGVEGENSPFTTAILKHIGKPGIDLDELMKRVRRDVYKQTAALGKQQVPWTSSSLVRDFHFVPVLTPLAMMSALQTRLKSMKCYSGRVDGKWGRGSITAMRWFSEASGVKLDAQAPVQSQMEMLRKQQELGLICPVAAPAFLRKLAATNARRNVSRTKRTSANRRASVNRKRTLRSNSTTVGTRSKKRSTKPQARKNKTIAYKSRKKKRTPTRTRNRSSGSSAPPDIGAGVGAGSF